MNGEATSLRNLEETNNSSNQGYESYHNDSSGLLSETDDSRDRYQHLGWRKKFQGAGKIVVSGVGFFSDAYDIFIINIVMVILSKEYPDITAGDKAWVSTAVLAGAIIGQILFGFLADKVGRKLGFIMTLSLVVVGAILSCASFKTEVSSIFVSLGVFRFILGIGIGGEYPLSATITSETASTEGRGRATAMVFSMQGWGQFVATVTGFLLILAIPNNLSLIWRLCLGLGAVPGVAMLYSRITMKETQRFQAIKRQKPDYKKIFKEYGTTLLGTAGTWLLLDITFYANGLFSATILENLRIGTKPGQTIHEQLIEIARFNILLSALALPGYWLAIFLIELPFFGRRNLQIIGFIMLAALYAVLAFTFESLEKASPWLFVIVYGLTFLVTNAGPNTTTFVLPSEVFPTEVRATCHGISAAAGKVGAVIGTTSLPLLLSHGHGLRSVLLMCTVVALAGGALSAFLTIETKGISLEKITRTNALSNDSTISTPEPRKRSEEPI